MDRNSLIILAAAIVILLCWWPFVDNFLYPVEERATIAPPEPAVENEPVEPIRTAPVEESFPLVETQNPDLPENFASAQDRLENERAEYLFDSLDGGLLSVGLKEFPDRVNLPESETGYFQLNPWTAATILGLKIDGQPVQGFSMSRRNDAVELVRELDNGLRIEKKFVATDNYLVEATARLVNTSSATLELAREEWAVGTATPMADDDDGYLMGLMFYDGDNTQRIKQSWFENRTLGCFPGTLRYRYVNEANPIFWACVDNQFFTVAVMTESSPADGIASVWNNLELSEEEVRDFKVRRGFETSLFYKGVRLAPGESIEREFRVYAGPKKYNVLSRLSVQYENELDSIMGYGGFFGFFAKALLLSMNGLYSLGLSYGLAIVAITFIIKILFWPLTRASTRSMKRMAALQPQMKEIQEKYRDNPQKMNKKLMAFMRENRVSPLGGCLPILLQLPVFFGFYTMLQSAIELRSASFLWTADLSKPDTLFIIPGIEIPFNLWPILMGAAQLWQTSMTPVSPGMDPMQQKIMKYMPLMFVVILYNFSAGLALYWTVQNILSIVQMKMTKNEPVAIEPNPRAAKKAIHSKKKRTGR